MTAAVATTALLHAEALGSERHRRVLFANLTVTVKPGELWQIVGPNGAGKTTLLRLLAGLRRPQQGRISSSPADDEGDETPPPLYLGHAPAVKDDLTARENLQFLCDLADEDAPAAALDAALAAVALTAVAHQPAGQLSAGQRRRIGLARLWITSRRLWLLDEPFTAIDRDGVAQLEGRLRDHCDGGGAVVLTSHQPLSLPHVRPLVLGAG